MIYPRLKLARDLLRDDGVIFISIDDNEQSNLKCICDEIFGEDNFAAQFVWTKTSTPPSLSKTCRKTVEYILAYEKKKGSNSFYGSPLDGGDAPLLNKGNPIKTLIFPPGSIHFNFTDQGLITKKDYTDISLSLENDIVVEHNKNKNHVRLSAPFKWEQDTLNQEIKNGTSFIVKTDKFSIRFLRQNNDLKFKRPNNFLNRELDRFCGVGTNESAQKELKELDISGFTYPKPVSLISYLIRMVTNETKDGIILDFFSGSGTTAQSVIDTNAKDGGSRQFILIQLNEKIDQNNEAFKSGFEYISDLGRERIKRCASIYSKNNNIDCGFRYFKLDESNMNDVFYKPKDLSQSALFELTDNIKTDRTPEDLLFQTLLSLGITLNCEYVDLNIDDKSVFNVANNFLIACFDKNINNNLFTEIAKMHPIYAVFRDSCFSNDSVADNFEQIFKIYSPETTCKVI